MLPIASPAKATVQLSGKQPKLSPTSAYIPHLARTTTMPRNPKCTCALNRYIVRGNHQDAAITQSHFEVIFADRSCFTFELPFHNIPTAHRTSANAERVLSSALITKVWRRSPNPPRLKHRLLPWPGRTTRTHHTHLHPAPQTARTANDHTLNAASITGHTGDWHHRCAAHHSCVS